MAEISAASNTSFAFTATRTLVSLRTGATARGIAAADETTNVGAATGRFVEVRAQLNRPDTRTALNVAVAAGTGIVSALKDLRAGFRVAASSLTNPIANLTNGDGTRVSVVNFSAQAEILLTAIDNLVAEAEVGGANLISSTALPVRLHTTAFGGSIEVAAQPLDRVGLGLDQLNLVANGGVDAGLAAVNEAITLAEQRLQRLEALQRAVGGSTTFTRQFLANLISDFGADSPARGTLVDLTG